MPKLNKPRKTWQYSNKLKAKAVQFTLIDGVMVKDVAETLDLHPMMLSRWRKECSIAKLCLIDAIKSPAVTNKQNSVNV
jgi:transposase